MPTAVTALAPTAHLWVFFRKGSKGAGHDMNRDDVWAIAERLNLRPLGSENGPYIVLLNFFAEVQRRIP